MWLSFCSCVCCGRPRYQTENGTCVAVFRGFIPVHFRSRVRFSAGPTSRRTTADVCEEFKHCGESGGGCQKVSARVAGSFQAAEKHRPKRLLQRSAGIRGQVRRQHPHRKLPKRVLFHFSRRGIMSCRCSTQVHLRPNQCSVKSHLETAMDRAFTRERTAIQSTILPLCPLTLKGHIYTLLRRYLSINIKGNPNLIAFSRVTSLSVPYQMR